jgi:Ion channel/Pentapeptide repeats (9 copies)
VLEKLFRLDGTPTLYVATDKLPPMSPNDEVINAVFTQGQWGVTSKRIKEVKFKNVAFSNNLLTKITFTDCNFEDCLFIGTQFEEVEFHGCHFVDCNFWKARFKQVYLDPAKIKLSQRFKVEAANVGVSVFQALLGNFGDERQDEFYMKTDILFRRWKRFQISADARRNRLSNLNARWRWFTNFVYDISAGYGYSPIRFFLVTLGLFFAISLLNHALIGDALKIDGETVPHSSLIDTIFYTFSILTVLGFSSIVPHSDFAKLLTVMEALLAVGWLGIFTSILVKRFLR